MSYELFCRPEHAKFNQTAKVCLSVSDCLVGAYDRKGEHEISSLGSVQAIAYLVIKKYMKPTNHTREVPILYFGPTSNSMFHTKA